jgi:hypothetical protein
MISQKVAKNAKDGSGNRSVIGGKAERGEYLTCPRSSPGHKVELASRLFSETFGAGDQDVANQYEFESTRSSTGYRLSAYATLRQRGLRDVCEGTDRTPYRLFLSVLSVLLCNSSIQWRTLVLVV